jgi:hypothetical protein
MRIIGFAQTVRLDIVPSEGYEIKVRLDSGEEFSIPTCEETVQALIQLNQGVYKGQHPHVTGDIVPEERLPAMPRPKFPQDYVASTGEEDTSEFGGDVPAPDTIAQRVSTPAADEMGYPIVPRTSPEGMPRPAFLGSDDEDGQQI